MSVDYDNRFSRYLPHFSAVTKERIRQDKKWGPQDHPMARPEDTRYLKEQKLAFQTLCNLRAARNQESWTEILLEEVFEALAEEDPAKQKEELIQVMAVCLHMVEGIDRKLGM